MSDLAQTLWQEFAVETDEHLAVLEPLLVRLGSGEGEASDVARLFRGFHSLKGVARAMGLYGMEAVAHRSENLLGLVRDNGVAMTEPMLDGLLESVDYLRTLRDAAVQTRADSAAPPALLHKLDTMFEAAGGREARPLEGATSPTADTGGELSEDSEMLQLFLELMQTRLVELARAFEADEAARADLVDTLETLQNAAGVMQFEQVAETLQELGAFLMAQHLPLDAEARVGAAERIAQIVTQAQLLGEVAGGDAGAQSLTEALRSALIPDQARALAGLAGSLGTLGAAARSGSIDEVYPAADSAAGLARRAHLVANCLAAAREAELLLLVEDVCARIARGEAAASELLASVMQFVTEAIAQAADVGRRLNEAEAADLARNLRDALEGRGAIASPQTDAVLALLKDRHMLEALSSGNIEELASGVAMGSHVYELMLFLEEAQAVGEAIVAWLSQEAKVITNITVLTNGESWFDFLVLSPLAAEAFRDGLVQRDPERRCIKWLREVGGEMLLEEGEGGEGLPAAALAGQPGGSTGGQRSATVLRVRSEVVDRLMNQIGEIRVAASELAGVATANARTREASLLELARGVETGLRRLQASALELRVVPIDTIFNRFPRVVRMLAQEQAKNVRLVLEGRDVRVDKSMVDLLADPLMHMVRNAVDHGTETPDERLGAGKPVQATVTLSAVQRGSEVQVQVSDDGRGLNASAILDKAVKSGLTTRSDAAKLKPHEIHRFIFAAGLSTAATVTETSGRGVGMDVVLSAVQQLGGDIDVESREGGGTTFTLRMPLSAAMQAALLVQLDGQTFGIAERFVSSVLEVAAEEMLRAGAQTLVRYKEAALPVYRLRDLLWRDDVGAAEAPAFHSVVVVSNGRESIGVEVDQVRGRQELFLKDLHPLIAACPTVGGAAVLGDGGVVLLLDVDQLIQLVRGGSWRGAPSAEGEA
jgi:chemotaxis protein histidine kinase CheA